MVHHISYSLERVTLKKWSCSFRSETPPPPPKRNNISDRIHGTGIFPYIWLILMVNVGKYTIHGSYGSLKNPTPIVPFNPPIVLGLLTISPYRKKAKEHYRQVELHLEKPDDAKTFSKRSPGLILREWQPMAWEKKQMTLVFNGVRAFFWRVLPPQNRGRSQVPGGWVLTWHGWWILRPWQKIPWVAHIHASREGIEKIVQPTRNPCISLAIRKPFGGNNIIIPA